MADFEGAPPVSNGAGRGQSPKSAAPPKIETKPETVDPETDGARTNGTGPPSAKSARTHGATDASSGRDYNQQPSATGSGASQAAAAAAGEVGVGDKRKRVSADDEIGSDLDDSDEEDGEGAGEGDGNEDMVLCLYDKVRNASFTRITRSARLTQSAPLSCQVQRVKNKWKCVLKDGVASIDGRDYLFTKCNGCVSQLPYRSGRSQFGGLEAQPPVWLAHHGCYCVH